MPSRPYNAPMALTSLLIATLLSVQPVKLTHTYVKDTKTTYAIEVKVEEASMVISGDVTFTVLDAEGNHSISCPKFNMSGGGGEETREIKIDKLKYDAKGLASRYTFDEQGVIVILPSVMGYLPDAAVEKDKPFEIKETRESFTLTGTGKLIDIAEKDGKKEVTIEYKVSVVPSEGQSAGELTYKSTFDVATGQLITASGKAEIGGGTSEISVKRKKA